MNRNTKHPDRPAHKRKPNSGDRTRNARRYRVTGSWNRRPDRPAIRSTPDRQAARRIARDMAEQGAYVIVEESTGPEQWRTLYELDGPALAAERRAAEDEQRRHAAAAEEAEAEHDRMARLMSRPPVARDATGRATVRHTTGARP